MKRITFLKSLLLAALLMVGASAWAAKTVIGSLDNTTGWWAAFSDYYTIAPNGSLTLTFTNYSVGDNSYKNWLGVLTNDADRGAAGYSEYYVLRADGHKWGNIVDANTYTYTCSDGIGMPSDNTDAMNTNSTLINALNGSNVILKITRSNATVTLRADFTTTAGQKFFQQMVADCGDGTQNIRFFLSIEKGHIENLCEGAWNNVQTLDFENADNYSDGWSLSSGANCVVTQGSRTLAGTATSKYYCFISKDRDRNSTYTISNDEFKSSALWKMEFDAAFMNSTANSNGRFSVKSSSGEFFYLTVGSGSTEAELFKGDGTSLGKTAVTSRISTKDTRSNSEPRVDTWYHFVLIGSSTNGVFLEIRDANDNTTLSSTKVSDFANATQIYMAVSSQMGQAAIDNVKLFKAINPKVTTHYELSNGTTLIDAVETEVIAGNPFTPSYPTSFQSGTKQYTYVSGGDEIASVTSDTEITIVYSETDMPAGTFYAETYEKNGGTTGWTPSNSSRFIPAILGSITNKFFSVDQNSRSQNSSTLTGAAWNQLVDKNTDFTMQFDVQLTNSNTDVPTFTINDYENSTAMLKLQPTAKNATTWIINDDADNPVTLTASTWYTIQYSRKGSLTYLTITPTAGGNAVLSQTQITTLSADGGIGKLVFATGRYNANIALDNVLIRAWQTGDTPEVTETTYTIQYRDENNNEIKDDVVNPTTVGTEDIVASSAEIASFYNADSSKKYIYKEGNDAITAVADAASNVITLVFREAATYHYTVTNNLGTEIANATGFEQDEIVQPYPRYELKDGKMYAKGATNNEYRVRFTLTEDNQAETIDGYADANIGGVVFYVEGENISGATKATEGTKSSRSSNAAVGQNSENSELTIFQNLAPGKYKICATFIKENSNAVRASFKVGETTYNATNSSASTNMVSADTEEFIITTTSSVVWTNNCNLDYVYIQRTGESKTITAAGWATYCSPYALDFTSAIDNLDAAYIVTGGANGVLAKTEVTGTVPAGTGLLLKGNGNCVIPVVASSNTDVKANKLVGVTANTQIDAETGYVLMASPSLGFYLNSNAFTVGANTAYLPAGFDGSSARMSFFGFDDTTTDIRSIDNGKLIMDNVYNLNGQRVSQPEKGLYIVNGKKVIMK